MENAESDSGEIGKSSKPLDNLKMHKNIVKVGNLS